MLFTENSFVHGSGQEWFLAVAACFSTLRGEWISLSMFTEGVGAERDVQLSEWTKRVVAMRRGGQSHLEFTRSCVGDVCSN